MRVEKVRVRDALPAIAWMAAIFALSSVPVSGLPGPPAYVAHFIEYAVLAVLLAFAFRHSPPSTVLLLTIAIAVAYGATDEVHQIFVPTRTADVLDWVADAAGAAVGAGAFAIAMAWRAR